MKISIIVVKFLLLGALFIISNQELYLTNPQDLETFYDLFGSWIFNLANHFFQISGYVINSEWLPPLNNETTSSEG
jgi:hypothetical protein